MPKNFILLFVLSLVSCSGLRYEKHPAREFRGVWVASVVNIDWPKSGNDPVLKQKKDFLDILEFYDDLNFNALIVQIRTAGDALYPSKFAPWSRFLTGKEGAPPPGEFEDPLQWMIEQTHAKGMQFHAWFNPYRATFDLDTTILDTHHDFYTHRDWMVTYGTKYYYNPGQPKVWEHLTQVVKEVVENYPIDAVHFDDYFYPYKVQGESFNDSLEYAQFRRPDQRLDDWRRGNVDSLVKNVSSMLKNTKPWVQFGISPFGVWKNQSTDPSGSETNAGQTTYEDLYADPLLWMNKGWLDYIVPQAYWSMEYPAASHRKIMQWWALKTKNSHLYMGNGPYKIRNNADQAWEKRRELPTQIALARSTEQVKGNVFFSSKSLLNQQDDVVRTLKRKFYQKAALPPLPLAPTNRMLAKPVISNMQVSGTELQLCVSHYDTLPRFVFLYQLKNKNDTNSKEILAKGYIAKSKARLCFEIDVQKIRLNHPMGIVIEDAHGNQSKMHSFVLNP